MKTAFLLLLTVAGCTVINRHEKVPGWPELKVIEHHVSAKEMRDRCQPFVGPLLIPEGCTLFYFDRGEAHIYVSKDFPRPKVLEHERLHARGYDHVGSNQMKRILQAWRGGAWLR